MISKDKWMLNVYRGFGFEIIATLQQTETGTLVDGYARPRKISYPFTALTLIVLLVAGREILSGPIGFVYLSSIIIFYVIEIILRDSIQHTFYDVLQKPG
jgi:hypothetical protein